MSVALLLLLAAQADTTCTTWGNTTRCHSENHSTAPPDYQSQQTKLDLTGFNGLGAVMRFKRQRAKERKIGKLVAAGRCDDARIMALENGNFALAEQVQGMCR